MIEKYPNNPEVQKKLQGFNNPESLYYIYQKFLPQPGLKP
jgi:hypothetical protein